MKDDDSLFSQDEEGVTTTEGISPEAPEEKPAPLRDESGRFAKGETEPETPEPSGAPPAPKEDRDFAGILKGLMDEREKRQRYEAEVAEYKRKLAAFEAEKQAPQVPDVIEDQQGFAAYLMQQQAQQRDHLEAVFSERFARKEYGNEAVDAALAAAQQQGVVAHFTRGPDRWERMCEWHKGYLAQAEIGNDPAAFRAKIEAELRAKIMAEMGASPEAKPTPPKSLAAAAGSGRASPSAGGDPLFD